MNFITSLGAVWLKYSFCIILINTVLRSDWPSMLLELTQGFGLVTPDSSLVPRPHLAHARRRGLVSQVQILGLAPKAWSGQSDRRRAFIRITWQQNKYFNHTAPSDVMIFIFHTDKFVIPTLTITRLQVFCWPKDLDFWHQTSSPCVSWVGSGHETRRSSFVAWVW